MQNTLCLNTQFAHLVTGEHQQTAGKIACVEEIVAVKKASLTKDTIFGQHNKLVSTQPLAPMQGLNRESQFLVRRHSPAIQTAAAEQWLSRSPLRHLQEKEKGKMPGLNLDQPLKMLAEGYPFDGIKRCGVSTVASLDVPGSSTSAASRPSQSFGGETVSWFPVHCQRGSSS